LREAIARQVSATKGPCAADEVVVGPGAKPGILFPILALVNPGDRIGLAVEPGMAHVKPGATGEIVWQFTQAGEFQFACLIPGHFEAGMFGKVVVQ